MLKYIRIAGGSTGYCGCATLVYRDVGERVDKAWKAWERRVASLFGGRRTGPGTGFGFKGEGRPDVEHEIYAIECKLYSRPSYATILEGLRQSERNCGDHVPLLVMRRKGDVWEDAVVAMRLETFLRVGDGDGCNNGC